MHSGDSKNSPLEYLILILINKKRTVSDSSLSNVLSLHPFLDILHNDLLKSFFMKVKGFFLSVTDIQLHVIIIKGSMLCINAAIFRSSVRFLGVNSIYQLGKAYQITQ